MPERGLGGCWIQQASSQSLAVTQVMVNVMIVWFADVQQNLDNCIGESGKTKHLMDVSQTLIN